MFLSAFLKNGTKMEASIIIPTYNRADKLKLCLEALKGQDYKNFEVIVVDDGSSDNTKKIVKSFKGLKTRYFYQEHSQQGVARNLGIGKARGKYIFFIGDDIIPEKNWLSEHLACHRNKDVAVLGLTLWHPNLKVNDFMAYLAPNGPQFNYRAIKNREDCGWRFFWTSNISLARNWLKEKFDDNFKGWGYEDLELGYRLEKKGLKIIYNPKSIAYHYHYYDKPEEFFKRQIEASKSAFYFIKKHPELISLVKKNRLRLWQKFLLIIFSIFPFLKKIKRLKVIYWKLKRRYYFERGLK